MTICVSAGHHPLARGAHCGDVWEHDEAVLWRDAIVKYLGPLGIAVPVPAVASPGAEKEKAAFINAQADCLIAVEVHFNSLDSERTLPAERGCLTYYYPGSSKGAAVAVLVQKFMSQHIKPDLGVHEGYVRMDPKYGTIWFMRDVNATAIIIEPDFIDRFAEFREKREEVCKGIANALAMCHDMFSENLIGD